MSMRLGLGQTGEVLDPKGVAEDGRVTAKDVTNLETENRSS
jgi:hypothetical protein